MRNASTLRWVAALLLLLRTPGTLALELERLDPHGKSELNLKAASKDAFPAECRVCHSPKHKERHLSLRPDIEATCASCHGKVPHSGAADHLQKPFQDPVSGKRGPLSCLDCHSPHRSGAKAVLSGGSPIGRRGEIPGDLEIRPMKAPSTPMLRYVCMDCHRWKN